MGDGAGRGPGSGVAQLAAGSPPPGSTSHLSLHPHWLVLLGVGAQAGCVPSLRPHSRGAVSFLRIYGSRI